MILVTGGAGFDTSFLPVEEGSERHVRDLPVRGEPCL